MGMNEPVEQPGRRLGRLPCKSTRKALQFSDFFRFVNLPAKQTYWAKKIPLARRTFGNDTLGNCTRAKQAYAAMRMERLEQKRTIVITDAEVIRVYREMSDRLYGGGDNGAYEDDALSEWRRPDRTFCDAKGRPYTIDAYLRINASNQAELRAGLNLSGAKGIAICLNLPWAFTELDRWHVPPGTALLGPWMPGSWGGHSLWATADYDTQDVIVDDTWGFGPRRVSWAALAAYCDEAHLVIDSVNAWRKQTTHDPKTRKVVRAALGDVRDAVNAVSSLPITA
jgi:hypothetical protein